MKRVTFQIPFIKDLYKMKILTKHSAFLIVLLLIGVSCEKNDSTVEPKSIGQDSIQVDTTTQDSLGTYLADIDTTLLFNVGDFQIWEEFGGTFIWAKDQRFRWNSEGTGYDQPGLPNFNIIIPINESDEFSEFICDVKEVLFCEDISLSPYLPSVPTATEEDIQWLKDWLANVSYSKDRYPEVHAKYCSTLHLSGTLYDRYQCTKGINFKIIPFSYDVPTKKVYLCEKVRLRIKLNSRA